MTDPKEVIVALFEELIAKRAPSYGPLVKLSPEASKAHAEFHMAKDALDAEVTAITEFFQKRAEAILEKQAAAIRVAHPEIGDRVFRINCESDSYQLQLDETTTAEAEKPRESPDWVKDMIKKGDVQ